MNPVEIDYSGFTDEQLSGLASTAWQELERRRRHHDAVTAAAEAYERSDAVDDAGVALDVLNGLRTNGWRIVRTDPNTEAGERVIVVEEWTGG